MLGKRNKQKMQRKESGGYEHDRSQKMQKGWWSESLTSLKSQRFWEREGSSHLCPHGAPSLQGQVQQHCRKEYWGLFHDKHKAE